jgi:hypothetical protein
MIERYIVCDVCELKAKTPLKPGTIEYEMPSGWLWRDQGRMDYGNAFEICPDCVKFLRDARAKTKEAK